MQALAILDQLIQSSPQERTNILNTYIRQLFTDFLELDSIEEVEVNQNFSDLGASSLEAVDFKLLLEKELGIELRTTLLFDYPRLEELVSFLLETLKLSVEDKQSEVEESTFNYKQEIQTPSYKKENPVVIIGFEGIFPTATSIDELWHKSIETSQKEENIQKGTLWYHQLQAEQLQLNTEYLHISKDKFKYMDKQQQWIYAAIYKALHTSEIDIKELSSSITGVFVAATTLVDKGGLINDYGAPYQIPIANKLSYWLDLKGPSETINTFCSSVYVALHHAKKALLDGECEYALVAGVNYIPKYDYEDAKEDGLHAKIISSTGITNSFDQNADGFIRSEGVGAMILTKEDIAIEQNHRIQALVKGTAVFHGGKKGTIETPNRQGIKHVIQKSIEEAGIGSDEIDYIEGHGIAHPIADVIEMSAIDSSYKTMTHKKDKKWFLSSCKPITGHPEIASGMVSLGRAIWALNRKIIPGIKELKKVNKDIGNKHSLILQNESSFWKTDRQIRYVGLNSYAIGGVNAHVILGEYVPQKQLKPDLQSPTPKVTKVPAKVIEEPIKTQPIQEPVVANSLFTKEEQVKISESLKTAFGLNYKDLDLSSSPIHYGFDSIKMVQWVRELEHALHIEIPLGDLLGVEDFKSFFELLASKLNKETVQQELITLNTEKNPISDGQRGIWFIQDTFPEDTSFNVPMLLKLPADTHHDFIEKTFQNLLIKYPNLRNSFQAIDADTVVALERPMQDFTVQYDTVENEEEAQALQWEYLKKPFDLHKDPLTYLYVITAKDSGIKHVIFVVHHIIIDGLSGIISLGYFMDQLRQLQAGKTLTTPTPKYIYKDFVQWEKQYLNSNPAKVSKAYWAKKLKDWKGEIALPFDYNSDLFVAKKGIGSQYIKLDKTEVDTLRNFSKTNNVTLSVVLLSAFKIFIYKLTQSKDITITLPIAGRPRREDETEVGFYVNMLPLRNEVNPQESFIDFIKKLKGNFAEGLSHSQYPFAKIVANLGIKVLQSPIQSFPLSYAYQNIFDGIAEDEELKQIFQPLLDVYQETNEPYALEVVDMRDNLYLQIKYRKDCFKDETIQDHLQRFFQLLKDIVTTPKKPISEHNIVLPEERETLLNVWAKGKELKVPDIDAFEAISNCTKKYPDHIAIEYLDKIYTYQEMIAKSQILAGYLQEKGVVQGDLVVLYMNRSPLFICNILALLQLGATYVPIDLTSPKGRTSQIIEDSKAKTVLLDNTGAKQINSTITGKAVAFYNVEEISEKDITPFDTTKRPNNIQGQAAYVMYTSGSTGRPKGAMISHKSVVNFAFLMSDYFKLTEKDKFIHATSLGFDVITEEIYPILVSGGTLVISKEGYRNVPLLMQEFLKYGVTCMSAIPAVLEQMVADPILKELKSLRMIMSGGDVIVPEVLKKMPKSIKCYNTYGPTEATASATFYEIRTKDLKEQYIPIGKPIANYEAYVLDQGIQLVPIGQEGELHIGGVGVGMGYLYDTEKTKRQFIDHPFGEGKLYKTGDLVKWNEEGQLIYIGRNDHQVKIRGVRIEPAEIAYRLQQHPEIEEANVVLVKEAVRLDAFYSGKEVASEELRTFLKVYFPPYMIPSNFYFLKEIPKLANGKVNKKALLEISLNLTLETVYIGPKNKIEETVQSIWAKYLKVKEPISVDANFFELGGHSITSIQILQAVQKTFSNSSIRVADLLSKPTIQSFAKQIKDTLETTSTHKKAVLLAAQGSKNHIKFIIPGMPGFVEPYGELAEEIAQNSKVYGIPMKGVSNEKPATTLAEMAFYNLQCIQEIINTGEIELYAHSYGGTVVYEMLKNWPQELQLNKVVFLDTPLLTNFNSYKIEIAAEIVTQTANSFGIKDFDIDMVLESLSKTPKEQWIQVVFDQMEAKKKGVPESVFKQIRNLMEHSLNADFVYDSPVPFDIQLVIAQDHTYTKEHFEGWKDCFHLVEETSVQADHFSMIKKPFDDNLLKVLNQSTVEMI